MLCFHSDIYAGLALEEFFRFQNHRIRHRHNESNECKYGQADTKPFEISGFGEAAATGLFVVFISHWGKENELV